MDPHYSHWTNMLTIHLRTWYNSEMLFLIMSTMPPFLLGMLLILTFHYSHNLQCSILNTLWLSFLIFINRTDWSTITWVQMALIPPGQTPVLNASFFASINDTTVGGIRPDQFSLIPLDTFQNFTVSQVCHFYFLVNFNLVKCNICY